MGQDIKNWHKIFKDCDILSYVFFSTVDKWFYDAAASFSTLIVFSCSLRHLLTNGPFESKPTEQPASFQREMPRSCKHEEGLGNATTSSRIIHKWLFCPVRSAHSCAAFSLRVCTPLLSIVSVNVVTRCLRCYKQCTPHFYISYFVDLKSVKSKLRKKLNALSRLKLEL